MTDDLNGDTPHLSRCIEAQAWISELKRAHVYLDQGQPFLSGKDCREIAELIEHLLSTHAPISASLGKTTD